MKKLPFNKAEFVRSALAEEDFPLFFASGKQCPEIAIAGRSNVGKSSLINHLLRNKSLAKVSSTPGKTQTINFFRIDQILTLVDLPGYGYAKVPKAMKRVWSSTIDSYLQNRPSLSLLLLLLDSRHQPTDDDMAFIRWAVHSQKERLFVFTKTDKLSTSEKATRINAILDCLQTVDGIGDISYVNYSVNDLQARGILVEKINRQLEDKDKWD